MAMDGLVPVSESPRRFVSFLPGIIPDGAVHVVLCQWKGPAEGVQHADLYWGILFAGGTV